MKPNDHHKINLAIVSPNGNTVTETFIKNHIDHLPFQKTIIYGNPFPYQDGITSISKPVKLFFRVRKFLFSKYSIHKHSIEHYSLRKILKKNNIQVVLAEYLLTGGYVYEICQELNIPIIATGLGYELSVYPILKENKERYIGFLAYCSAVIVVAKWMRKVVIDLGCDANKIIYSPAGASEVFYKIQPSFANHNILAVGRFIEKKSPHLTILAFKKVVEKIPSAKLYMAGTGVLLTPCKDIVNALDITKNVFFLGNISQEEQQSLLAESYMFVQHSRISNNGDSEGTPVAILEASAGGVPVVSTAHAGIIDTIIHDKTGFLVDELDINAMSNYMIKLLEDIELARKMGAEGKQFVNQNFSLKNHIKTIEETILQAVK